MTLNRPHAAQNDPKNSVVAEYQRSERHILQPPEVDIDALIVKIEDKLINAVWTLRRLPDREMGFLYARQSLWPDAAPDTTTYAPQSMTTLQARKKVRPTAHEVDAMQPALDLLTLLPDLMDRRVLFWGAWHQDGERQSRIPWAKVRRSLIGNGTDPEMANARLSRWTLKRRYANSLKWLASIIAMHAE